MCSPSEKREHVVLGVPVDARRGTVIRKEIRRSLTEPGFIRIATVNPEFLVRARRDSRFREALLSADTRVVDGTGIALIAFLEGTRLSRIPGADLLRFILGEAERNSLSVLFVLSHDGLSTPSSVIAATKRSFPELSVDAIASEPETAGISDAVRSANIVLCSFGAPEQEYFLETLRDRPGAVRFAMGIGGAVDFLSGTRPRAPRALRFLGLEWLFRFAISPQRVGRIWDAVVVFPFLCLSDRMKSENKNR